MIKIKVSPKNISILGHAEYDDYGKDIVCAGVSTLLQTLIQSVETLTDDEIKYTMSPGKADIEFRNLSGQSKTLLNSFFIGVEMIAYEYPENVKIDQAWKSLKATE
jgi:uncharacterized protein YsxB (DUF464 family)